ncbi:MAG: Abortive infection protein, partial [Friedmanniella sp.]|nr:Abortive infection protein [Friedmanniella sp.]
MAHLTPSSVEETTYRSTPEGITSLPQYRLPRILAIWASAALPMAALSWLMAPLLAHGLTGPAALPRALILALTAGLFWQFLVVLFLVRREQGSLRWTVVKDALWLHAPRRPK